MSEDVNPGSHKIITTEDGSHSIFSSQFNCSYHSVKGAISESRHVFISNGLEYFHSNWDKEPVNILEFGFGTGLNALLALQWSKRKAVNINYQAIEAYPISIDQVMLLNYPELLDINPDKFIKLHTENSFHDGCFHLVKVIEKYEDYTAREKFDVIFFDPFGPDEQPQLWEQAFLNILPGLMAENGILVTYSVKGTFRRALENLGFFVEKLPGPLGKREVLRSTFVG